MLYRALIRPLFFLLPAETAHYAAFVGLRAAMAVPGLGALSRALLTPRDPILEVRALGCTFANPVGLAAGFDKDAEGFAALARLGFGFIEVGTLTAHAQPGNPRPRMFRLSEDRALINRMGFNNHGARRAAQKLTAPHTIPIGANIGKSKATPESRAVEEYSNSAAALAPVADYLVVNVSSPNTPGLRDLQAIDKLRPILAAVREAAGDVPLLVKISPDLSDSEIDAIADLALELSLDGIVAVNTTIARTGLRTPAERVRACGEGGLSGAPLKEPALAVLTRLRRRLGDRLVLIAAGGIENADDAWERIVAGASLVQIYTGFVYGGPLAPRRIARGLAERARAAGYASISDAVGAAVDAGGALTSTVVA